MSVFLALLVIIACLLMLGASSPSHMVSPNHPEVRKFTRGEAQEYKEALSKAYKPTGRKRF